MDKVEFNIFNKAASKSTPDNISKIDQVSREFEEVFLTQAFEEMFKTVKKSNINNGGFAEETWRSFMSQQYAKEVAKSGDTGIAESIKSMIKKYEG